MNLATPFKALQRRLLPFAAVMFAMPQVNAKSPADYVNPFIGTSNYGATHPGAQYPQGLASLSPFNVAYEKGGLNTFEKDAAWNSRVYIKENRFLTGFSHINLSGVGCPDMGVILAMPTTGKLQLDAEQYGSTYRNEQATPGYYKTHLDKYRITSEVTSTLRTGLSRYTFPKGESHIIFNLGLGLTNETGASIKVVSPSEIEGSRTVGSFCYHPEDVRPVYFVAQFSKPAKDFGTWKKMPAYNGVEGDWVSYNHKIKPYPGYSQAMSGDNIGSYFSYQTEAGEQIQVKVGISFVSIDNARKNLRAEQAKFKFKKIRKQAHNAWNQLLNRVKIKGKESDLSLFYTALYHSLIHPSILQDVNGDYPLMNQPGFGNTQGKNRYTVYSLWDTYRNVHPLLSLIYPEIQADLARSMVNMYRESGWLPKWELMAMETQVMVGDPGSIVLADTYLRGIRDFDIEQAWQAMLKAAETSGNNPIRPDNALYLKHGYVPVDNEGPYDGSVSTSLEYYLTDFNIAQLAKALGKTQAAKKYNQRALQYRQLFDKHSGMLRPKQANGEWLRPYDPELGRNFEPAPGYIEGNAWNYRFYVPHDIPGIIQLLGGEHLFIEQLEKTFSSGNFDMANEPDFTYPFLFNYVPNQSWKTSRYVAQLIAEHFTNSPGGLPGNDDTGAMSAWLAFSMLGIYPVSPGNMDYAVFQPRFDSVTIQLNNQYYPGKTLHIRREGSALPSANSPLPKLNKQGLRRPFVSHQQLVQGGELLFTTADAKE